MRKFTQAWFIGASLLAACGGGDSNTIDGGGSGSGAIDASPTPDAIPTGTANVVVHDAVAPAPVAKVVVHHPGGGWASTTDTDANGLATVNVEQGGSVSVVYPPNQPLGAPYFGEVLTLAGVKPGDTLHFGDQPFVYPTTENVTFTYPALAMATSYDIITPCGSGSTGSLSASITMGCDSGAVAVIATVPHGKAPVTRHILLQDTATFTGTVALTGSYADMRSTTYSLTGLPAVVEAQAGAYQRIGLNSFHNPSPTLTRTDGTLSGQGQTFPGTAVGQAFQYYAARPQASAQQVFANVGNAATISLAYSDFAQPFIVGQPFFDVEQGLLLWNRVGTGTPDLAFVRTDFYRGGDAPGYFTWRLAAPLDATTTAASALEWPAELDQLNLTGEEQFELGEFVTARLTGGWDAIRSVIHSSGGESVFNVPNSGNFINLQFVGNNFKRLPAMAPTASHSGFARGIAKQLSKTPVAAQN